MPQNPNVTRKKRILRRLAVTTGATIVTLLLIEAALQVSSAFAPRIAYLLSPPWTRIRQPDAELGHHPSQYYPDHDSRGFRNEAALDTCDLIAIGDSMTYGYAAARDGSWPAQLSAKIGRPIYNLSFGSYGPCEYSVLLRRSLELEPKLILIGLYLGNDLSDCYRTVYLDGRSHHHRTSNRQVLEVMARADREETLRARVDRLLGHATSNQPQSIRHWLSENSALLGLIRQARLTLGGSSYRSGFREDEDPRETFAASAARFGRIPFDSGRDRRTVFLPPEVLLTPCDLADPRIAEGERILRENLVQMKTRAQSAGSRIALVLIPSKHFVYESGLESFDHTSREALLRVVASERKVLQRTRSFLEDTGIPYAFAGPALREALSGASAPYQTSDDEHPNRVGYAAIARAARDLLRDFDLSRNPDSK